MSKQSFDDIPMFALQFLDYLENIKAKSSNTISEYYYDIRTFLRWIKLCKMSNSSSENSELIFLSTLNNYDPTEFKNLSTTDITLDEIRLLKLADIHSYLAWLNRVKNNSARARARKVACLRSFFKFLCDKANLLDYNPTTELESPKISKKLPKYLSLEESQLLLTSIDGAFEKRDYAIIVLFLNCGMRLSELVGINITDIRDNKLTVVGKGDKERTIYLNNACMDAINDYLAVRPHDNVVGNDRNALFLSKRKKRISKQTVQHIVKKFIAISGLDYTKYSTHKLRHTAATMMYQYGNVDIRVLQEILGHESVATTEIYTHLNKEKLRDASDANPLSNFKK